MTWIYLKGLESAYIGRWDEPESLDQTDFINGVDWTSMAVGEPTLEAEVDRWTHRSADLGVGSADLALCQIGPTFGGTPSRIF
jgi:hypothetical protein